MNVLNFNNAKNWLAEERKNLKTVERKFVWRAVFFIIFVLAFIINLLVVCKINSLLKVALIFNFIVVLRMLWSTLSLKEKYKSINSWIKIIKSFIKSNKIEEK